MFFWMFACPDVLGACPDVLGEGTAMTASFDQQREWRLRQLADRQGYRLQKLRGDGGYWLLDVGTAWLIMGEQTTHGVCVGYDLDAIEDWLCDRN